MPIRGARPFLSAGSLFCFLVLLRPPAGWLSLFTQESSPAQQQSPPVLKSVSELVDVDVSVADKHGNLLANLQPNNFRILDDGTEKPIAYFASVDAPAQLLILVETSPAVYLIHRQHLEAAYALVEGLAPQDRAALATYDASPKPLLPFTGEKRSLAQALLGVQYTLGTDQLNFYDSVSAALDWLNPVVGKKGLLLLTTGLDTSRPERWDELAKKLRGRNVTVFSVALGGSLREYRQPVRTTETSNEGGDGKFAATAPSFAKADAALQEMARISGGQVFFPKAPKDFAEIYRRIASLLRHQYVVAFLPSHDARFHAIEIQVRDASGKLLTGNDAKPGYRIYARSGYMAPQP